MKVVTDPFDQRYLLDAAIPSRQWVSILNFHSRRYMNGNQMTPNGVWPKSTPWFHFVHHITFAPNIFVVNLIHYEIYNVTLFQFGYPLMRDDEIFILPFYWFRGIPTTNFKIGDRIKGSITDIWDISNSQHVNFIDKIELE